MYIKGFYSMKKPKMVKKPKEKAIQKIVSANYEIVQFVNAVLLKHEDCTCMSIEEKEGLRQIEKHMINLNDSISKNL